MTGISHLLTIATLALAYRIHANRAPAEDGGNHRGEKGPLDAQSQP